MEPIIDVKELGEYVKRKRQEDGLSLREVSTVTGVSPATLSRIENGIGIPDSTTLARLAGWLGIPLDRLMKGALLPTDTEHEVVYRESTPDIVEAHLRADPSLKPETAKALSELFRVAYNQFAQTSLDSKKGK